MCDADTSVMTYNWVKGHRFPHPNFNVQHKCRDFDAVFNWALERQAHAPEQGYISRPADYVEFDDPPFDPLANE